MMHEDDIKRKVLGHLMDLASQHDRSRMAPHMGIPADDRGDFPSRHESHIVSEVHEVPSDKSTEHSVPVHEPVEENLQEQAHETTTIPDHPTEDEGPEESEPRHIDMIGMLAKRHSETSKKRYGK